jgi:predicted nucleotidyltransferase
MFNQDADYHLRGIARLINVSPVYVGKELDNLSKLNLVKKSKKGNLSIYSINKDNYLLDELRNMFIKTDYLGELLKKKLEGKVIYAFIYGSFAKGEETASSDIDLFVIGDIKEDELLNILQELEKKVDREINYILWTEKTFLQKAKSHHLLKTIKKSRLIMLIGDENELKRTIK